MSYSLTTYAHRSARAVISTKYDLNKYNIILEFGDRVESLQPSNIGTIEYLGDSFVLQLSEQEVDEVKESFFRVKAIRKVPVLDDYFGNNNTIVLVEGYIDYIESKQNSDMMDSAGRIKESLLPLSLVRENDVDVCVREVIEDVTSLTRNKLDIVYMPKVEYVQQSDQAIVYPAYDDMPSLKILFENGLI